MNIFKNRSAIYGWLSMVVFTNGVPILVIQQRFRMNVVFFWMNAFTAVKIDPIRARQVYKGNVKSQCSDGVCQDVFNLEDFVVRLLRTIASCSLILFNAD